VSACSVCPGGVCKDCKQTARKFRQAVRRAMVQPGFLALLKRAGNVKSDPTEASPEGRTLEGGLPESVETQSILLAISRAVQTAVRENEPAKAVKRAR